jgi:hypothetical protein
MLQGFGIINNCLQVTKKLFQCETIALRNSPQRFEQGLATDAHPCLLIVFLEDVFCLPISMNDIQDSHIGCDAGIMRRFFLHSDVIKG